MDLGGKAIDENATRKRVTVFDDRGDALAMTMYIESGQVSMSGQQAELPVTGGEKWECSSISSTNDVVRLKNVMKTTNQDLDSVIDITNQTEGVGKQEDDQMRTIPALNQNQKAQSDLKT